MFSVSQFYRAGSIEAWPHIVVVQGRVTFKKGLGWSKNQNID